MENDLIERLRANALDECDEAIAEIERLKAQCDELAGALRGMIRETTQLEPDESDGHHWCRITRPTFRAARDAIAKLEGWEGEQP